MGLPFENIKISGFRGLKDLSLEGLGRVNLLVGENNSGKTSVLEAISIYANPFDWPNWLTTARSRDLRSVVPGAIYPRIELIKWLFIQSANENADKPFAGTIKLLSSGEAPWANLIASAEEMYGSPPEPRRSSRYKAEIDREANDIEEQPGLSLTVKANTERLHFQYATTTIWEYGSVLRQNLPKGMLSATMTPVTHRIMDTQLSFFSKARFANFKDQALDAVRLIDDGIMDLEILVPTGYKSAIPYVRHTKVGLAPLNAFGDGLRRVLIMALMLASVQKGILLIDEIETAIHKDALAKVFSWLVKTARDMDVQVFATTHSLEAVDAILKAELETLDEVVGYHLEREGEQLHAKRLSGELLKRLRYERGLDIR